MILSILFKRAARKTRETEISLMLRRMAAALNFPAEARRQLRHLKLSMLTDKQLEEVHLGLTEMLKQNNPQLMAEIIKQVQVLQN